MEHLADRFARIPGVQVVVLGGSRAAGNARPDSDWDFGLYYRGTLDVDAVRALAHDGEVFAPGEWGVVPNGGAWLVIDGVRVDLLYRDLDTVEAWTADAEQGRFRVFREVGYVAGATTYSYAAELAFNRHLVGSLPRPAFPDALRASAPQWWERIRAGALTFAGAHARRDDATACLGNLAVAVLAAAHAELTRRGEWYLNEKDLVARAGLDDVQPLLRAPGDDLAGVVAMVAARIRPERRPGA
jgi:predicted nucleotidyltransferase